MSFTYGKTNDHSGRTVDIFLIILFVVLAIFVVAILTKSFRIVPRGHCGIIQRLGKYQRTQMAGLTMIAPFVDAMLSLIDTREQVVVCLRRAVITRARVEDTNDN